MSLLENFAENFGANFQHNHSQINKLGQKSENNLIADRQESRQRNWTLFVIGLKLHEHNHSNDYLKVTSVSKTFATVLDKDSSEFEENAVQLQEYTREGLRSNI